MANRILQWHYEYNKKDFCHFQRTSEWKISNITSERYLPQREAIMKAGFNWILPRKSIEGVKQTIGIPTTWEYAFDAGSTINPFLSSRNSPFHLSPSLLSLFAPCHPLVSIFLFCSGCIQPCCDCRFPVWNFRLSLRANSTARKTTLFPPTTDLSPGPFLSIPWQIIVLPNAINSHLRPATFHREAGCYESSKRDGLIDTDSEIIFVGNCSFSWKIVKNFEHGPLAQ